MSSKKPELSLPQAITSGLESIWRGWKRPVEALLDQLEADITGLKLRLSRPVDIGEPGAYQAVKVFPPRQQVVSYISPTDESVTANVYNQIIKSGVISEVTTIMPGPGVFVCEAIRVHMLQRTYVPGNGVTWQHMNEGAKVSVQDYGYKASTIAADIGPRRVNFLWNITDKAGRRLSNDFMSAGMLCPRSSSDGSTDGDWFKFDTPWLIERDGQLTFQFFPVTEVLQLESGIDATQAPYNFPFDDREGGSRDESVALCVEYHGYRYKTDQDAIRAGALVHDSY